MYCSGTSGSSQMCLSMHACHMTVHLLAWRLGRATARWQYIHGLVMTALRSSQAWVASAL